MLLAKFSKFLSLRSKRGEMTPHLLRRPFKSTTILPARASSMIVNSLMQPFSCMTRRILTSTLEMGWRITYKNIRTVLMENRPVGRGNQVVTLLRARLGILQSTSKKFQYFFDISQCILTCVRRVRFNYDYFGLLRHNCPKITASLPPAKIEVVGMFHIPVFCQPFQR